MAIGASLPSDYNHPQVQPPAEVRSAESLGVPKGPEIDPQNPVFILRKKVSGSVGEIIHVAERGAVSKNTSEKTGELRSDREKKEFLTKLIPTLKADSPIKQAIEKKTLQIHEVPGRDLYALSLDGRDVDFLLEKSGKEYFDFHWRRADMMRYAAFQGLSNDKFMEKVEGGRYKIIKDGKTLDPFSTESLVEYVKWADHVNIIIQKMKAIQDHWRKMEREGK